MLVNGTKSIYMQTSGLGCYWVWSVPDAWPDLQACVCIPFNRAACCMLQTTDQTTKDLIQG